MRSPFTLPLGVFGCFVFTATAWSQSLVELAEKEKARRAEIAKAGVAADVIDADALSRIDPNIVTAIEVTGSSQPSSSASAAERPRPPLENPIRATPFTPPSTTRAPQDALDRGWSSGTDHALEGRGWSQPKTHAVDGRGWSQGPESAPGNRGWSDRPSTDRSFVTGGDYETSDRGWTSGRVSPTSGRGWSQR